MKHDLKGQRPTGKINIAKDRIGSPNMDIVNAGFASLQEATQKDYTVRKQILWESASCS